MRRTISGMIGTGSLAHNRRDFIAENVDPDRVHLNICYQNENLKEVYKELFDDSVERYNVGKRKDRQITNYYEKIRQGKQEKLFHEVIFQIGNREDMAVGTTEGDLAVKVLDEYVKNFQQRNPTLHVFSCYLHQDEATPHLHIDFVPYVTGWKGKGMDARVSLKQALKSLGFQGGNKHDTELNQWINHEKEVLAGVKNVICNIDMGNLLHQYALKNKEVSKIEVAHKERRIHVTYSCKNDLWYEFDLRNRGLAARSLYIPKKNMVISGLKEEIGVKNFGGIYIQSNTELCEYLIKVIGAFQSEDTEENKILLEVFLSYVFDNKVLEVAYKQDVNTSNMFKQLLEERFVRVSNELIEKMWAKIDTQEFVNKILTKNYTLYSIDNWSRKNDSI